MLTTGSFRVKAGYLAAFLLLVISYVLIFLTFQQFLKQSRWVEHTDLVINDLETLSSYLNETESAGRGYVILNDSDQLQSFYSGTTRIDSLLKNIDSITSDNIIHQRRLDTLKELIQDKLGRMYRGVLSYKQAGNAITSDMKEKGQISKMLMMRIRNTIRQMEDAERQLLLKRKEKLRAVSISVRIIAITSLIIAILLSVYSFVTSSRQIPTANNWRTKCANYKKLMPNYRSSAALKNLRQPAG
jgi:CHASE3 domain sensor protein